MSEYMTPDQVAILIAEAIVSRNIIVHAAKCQECQLGDHFDPPRRHPWWDEADVGYALDNRQPAPSGDCGCYCAKQAAPIVRVQPEQPGGHVFADDGSSDEGDPAERFTRLHQEGDL